MEQFDKIYSVDTNIIMNNHMNVVQLSENGKNLIIIPETVLDELDNHKSGFEEKNFQSRAFARLLYDAKIENKITVNDVQCIKIQVHKTTIYIISKDIYTADNGTVDGNIRNDRKILEVTKDLSKDPLFKDIIFVSLDVMARTRAISIGIDTEALNLGVETDIEMEFHEVLELPDYDGNIKNIPGVQPHISSIEITNADGKTYIYYNSSALSCTWELIDDKNTKKIPLPPINKKQKVLTELILGKTDISVISGPAGTGKSVMALASAMRLIDTDENFKKIYYIRRTVISGSTEDELGFLPGTLEEKMKGYNQPMEDSIKKIAQAKKKKQTREEIEENIEIIRKKYDIEYLYSGHLRGSTLEEGSILICDEIQNFDLNSIRTIFSRLNKNSIIVAMGSNNQIDSKYLTKNTNALTFLIGKCGSENISDVSVKGVKLTNVMRSKIAEWSDLELYNQ